MKKEKLTRAINRVKQAYGVEATVNTEIPEQVLDPHQMFTDKIMKTADYAGMAVIYGSLSGYCAYRLVVKVPEVLGTLSQIPDTFYQYITPFINS